MSEPELLPHSNVNVTLTLNPNFKQEPVEPGFAPRIGIGHILVVCKKIVVKFDFK